MPLRVCVKTFPERTSWGEKAHPEHRWYHSNRLRAWTKCQRNVTFPLLSASWSTEMWRSSLMFLLPGRSWSLFVNNMPFHPSVASNPARNAPSCSDFPMEELPEAILLAPLCFPPLLLTIYVTHSAPTSCSLSFSLWSMLPSVPTGSYVTTWAQSPTVEAPSFAGDPISSGVEKTLVLFR